MLDLGARARPGAVVREVGATREPVAVTDRGRTVAVLVDPADGPRPGGAFGSSGVLRVLVGRYRVVYEIGGRRVRVGVIHLGCVR
ncbi:type II toxin-antitoxin system Phd/YefM family antitoxin [Streptomyces sp. MRC013]|uniref:type II toxin-antitoxin system Phd/YefM family antitoxin n=1 Tax=Streptomyces sp. MRC013 TaxID=2898276 RepID=UPI00202699C4|nr:type II toxin-antitoxin system Phd/YefM family antitoxin [Streptomyces sp. MRC013]URM89946.1 type II toxin-antitoxin system Phd/YefM family antitoxin [Streptomyces sp. MRC013]